MTLWIDSGTWDEEAIPPRQPLAVLIAEEEELIRTGQRRSTVKLDKLRQLLAAEQEATP